MNTEELTNEQQSVKKALSSILSSLKKEMKADIATLYVYDSENGSFHLPVGIGLRDPDSFNDPMMRPKAYRGAAKLALVDLPLCIERTDEHPELYGAFVNRERIRSFAKMPCLIDRQIVGVLFVSYHSQHSFSKQEEKILQGCALRVGKAIVESSILRNLPEVKVGQVSSQKKILQGIIELACSSTNSSIGIWLFDPKENGRLCLWASTGFSKSYGEKAYRKLDDGSIISQVFTSGIEQVIEDLQNDESFSYKEFAHKAGWKSVFCYPINSRSKRVGVIESFTFKPWTHNQGFIRTHHQLVDLIGMTLKNSCRSEEAEQIADLTQNINIEPKFESTLQKIVDTVRNLTDAASSSIFIYDKRTRSFTYGALSPCNVQTRFKAPRKKGLTKYIIDTGKLVHIHNTEGDKLSNKLRVSESAKSLIGVRLDVGQEEVGVLYVRANRIDQFVEADVELLKTIAAQATLGFLGRSLLRPIREIEDVIAKRLVKDKILKRICDQVMGLGYNYAAIQLISQEERIIETVHVEGVKSDWTGVSKHSLSSEEDIRDIQADIALEDPPLVKIVTGWCEKFDRWIYDEFNHSSYARVWVPIIVVRDEKGKVVDDWIDVWDGKVIKEGEVFDPNQNRSGYITRIKMSLPTVKEGHKAKIIGTIDAGYTNFNADNQDLKDRIKLPEAIDLAKMAARLALDLRQTMLPYVLENIADRAWKIIHADSASLHFLFNRERKKFSYEVCMGKLSQEFLDNHQPRPKGLGQKAISEGKVQFVPDIEKGHADNELETTNPKVWKVGVRAMAAVPLLMQEKSGVLYVLFRKPHKFTRIELDWIQLFANRAAEAISNAHSYDQIRNNERALTALHSISNSLASKPQDEHLLQQIAGNAMNVLAADTTTIIEYEEANKRFLMPPDIAGRLLYETEKARTRELGQNTPPNLLLSHTKDLYIAENCQNDLIMDNANRVNTKNGFFIEREKIQSSAGIILRVAKENQDGIRTEGGNEIVGAMFVNFRRHHVFTEQERKIIKTLATNAGIAIKNRRSLAALTAGTHEILTTLDLKKLLGLIVQRAVNITGGDVGNIRLVEGRDSDELVAYAQHPENEEINENLRRIKVGEGFIGMVADMKVARIVSDMESHSDPRQYFFKGLRSCVYVPMLTGGGELLGILASGSRETSKFDKNDLLMLKGLADQAVISLQNAKQQEQLSATETMATLGDIVGNLIHNVNNDVGAIKEFSIMLERQVEDQVRKTVGDIFELSKKILAEVNELNKSIPERAEGADVLKALDAAIHKVHFSGDIAFSRELPQILPPAKGGELQIQNLFANLFQNAVDAMPDGGKLHVNGQILSRGVIELLFKDTGIGIPDDHLDKVFEQGFTKKKGRLGFGLWWNKNYLDRLGGDLKVHSTLGEGSCFIIHLPIWGE